MLFFIKIDHEYMYWPTNGYIHAVMCEKTQRATDVYPRVWNDAVGWCEVDVT